MSQNLTQPEEIDRILMEMAERNIAADKPIQDEAQLSRAIDSLKCDASIVDSFLCGAAHKKLIHGLTNR